MEPDRYRKMSPGQSVITDLTFGMNSEELRVISAMAKPLCDYLSLKEELDLLEEIDAGVTEPTLGKKMLDELFSKRS